MGSIRSFVAVLLPDAVRAALAAEIERLRAAALNVDWVAPENLHVTLKFLGSVAAGRLADTEAALGRVASAAPPFDLTLGGIGAFPTSSRPRVIWAGVLGGRDALGTLAGRVHDALADLGFEREARAYSPHVTLGRVRAPRRDAALAAVIEAAAGRGFGTLRVNRLVLMRSDPSPRGSRYTALVSWPLGL